MTRWKRDTVHCGKCVVGLLAVILITGGLYVGHRVDAARQGVENYRKAFGYQTPTTGLKTCLFSSPAWQGVLIDSSIPFTDGAHNMEPVNLDGDSDLEFIANSYRSDTLVTYDRVRAAQNPHDWTRRVIDARVGDGFATRPVKPYVKNLLRKALVGGCVVGGAHYTAVSDLNGDSRADLVVAGDEMHDDFVWYEAVGAAGGDPPSWLKHVAYRNDSHRTYHVDTGDVDGDGDRDIVFATKTDNSVGWLENCGTPDAWPAMIIDSNCIRGFYARVSDLNQDGKGEIIASQDSSRQGGKLLLYTYSGDPQQAGNWVRRCISSFAPGHGVSVFSAIDLDNNGTCDIAAASHQGDVYVLRNPGPGNASGMWEAHLARRNCPRNARDFREIDVGDIDLDSDPDIIVADEAGNAVVWYENPGATFCDDWPEHVVDRSDVYLRWCHSVRLADVDRDGDLDIAVAAAASNTFLLYTNETLSGVSGGGR